MKYFYIFILSITAHFLVGQKTLLVENFDYEAGSLIRMHGWTSHSSGDVSPIATSTNGLSLNNTMYAGSGIGRAALITNNGSDENKPFSESVAQPGANENPIATYASFLLKPSDVIPPASGTTRPYFFHFVQYSSPASPNFASISTAHRARTFIVTGSIPNTFKLNLSFNENEPLAENLTADLSSAQTHLIVVKYVSIAGDDNDEVSLYLFKDGDNITSEPTKPTIGPLKGTNADITLQGVALRQYQANQNVIMDGIIVKDHWNLMSLTSNSEAYSLKSDITIFPNPASEKIISITIDEELPQSIRFFDSFGRFLTEKEIHNNTIDISDLSKGVYFLKSKSHNGKIQKLIRL
jgi:hypothetical protein